MQKVVLLLWLLLMMMMMTVMVIIISIMMLNIYVIVHDCILQVSVISRYKREHPVLASIQRSAQLAFRRGLVDGQRHVQQ